MALIESNIALLDRPEPIDEFSIETQPTTRPQTYQAPKKLVMPLLQNESEIQTISSRLKCLCTLIKRARSPFCSVNGIVVLIPFCSSEDQNVANHTGLLIEQDLQAITDATQIDAPRIAVFCDLQQATGCVDLLDRFPEQQSA